MDPTRWHRIKSLFARAISLPAEERAFFLQADSAGDEEVLREVEALLREHPESAAPPARSGGSRVGAGTVIGPYKLLQEIGEGGFGVVYLAQQEAPMRRRVALKVLKPGMDSRQVVARFEQERQALAMMDHPNIAQVFDGGATDSGQPYFVMELVRGDPITDYCDRERLDTRARLGLFAQVCRAIQHAHQKGVIHRDLKPSNVLVTIVDGQPTPKVIDFGVAKATQERLTSATLFTEHRQMLGTPLYMSPEQAALSGTDVDTRSDVYSLGVLLYELLTGATPFDRQQLLQAGLAEMQRVILEVEPQKPSTRAAALSRTNATVAAQRRVETARLGPLLRGDLDWIAMKCLEKERARRYETALELAQDVERHLEGEPVQAAPPSTFYRLRKFVRRNRQSVASACLLAGISAAWVVAKVGAEQNRAHEAAAANQRQQLGDYIARIEAAAAAIQQDDIGRARELLDDCPRTAAQPGVAPARRILRPIVVGRTRPRRRGELRRVHSGWHAGGQRGPTTRRYACGMRARGNTSRPFLPTTAWSRSWRSAPTGPGS
jgi:serine/threonine protein kinase